MEEENQYRGHCTEILGCESETEKINGLDLTRLMRRNSEKVDKDDGIKEKIQLEIFPPLLTILSAVNGRPRFALKKVTDEDGRLRIDMVRSQNMDILHCLRIDGRLRMWIVSPDDDDDEDNDNDNDDDGDNGGGIRHQDGSE